MLLSFTSIILSSSPFCFFFFFFNDTATTEIYTLSLHDALPIYRGLIGKKLDVLVEGPSDEHEYVTMGRHRGDRKSTRLNSSHGYISYAVFCLKKKKKNKTIKRDRKA